MKYCTAKLPSGSIRYYESDKYIYGWTLDRVQPDSLLNFFNKKSFIQLKQIHSEKIFFSENINNSTEGDGIIHNSEQGITAIRTADCVPLFFWSDKTGIAGILHSGWRSFQKGIATNLLSNFISGESLSDLHFFAGPSISGNCYEVGPEVRGALNSAYKVDEFCKLKENGKYLLDIKEGLKYELMNHGVPEANICLSDICTHCAEGYHSYRQNKTKERIYNFILNR